MSTHWLELANQVLQLQAAVETCKSEGGICPATAFNAITAAFATQGYFMQADMLYFLVGTGFGIWAPFIYMIAAAGGIISLAMGAPPRMYVWFFVGPGIYHWLVETRAPAHGVQWQVARVYQDQRQVWRMAHVGIINSNLVARMAGEIDEQAADTRYELQTDVKQTSWCKPTTSPVYVSNFFLWFDSIISYTVQRLVDMTGITRTTAATVGSGGTAGSLPLPEAAAGGASDQDSNKWYLLSDKKWVLLDTITSARLNSSDLRDAFATFLSSECGDAYSSTIDNTNFVAAANSGSGNLPCTVNLHTNTSAIRTEAGSTSCTGGEGGGASAFLEDKYKLVWDSLRTVLVPIPEGLRRIFQDDADGSFVAYLNGEGGDEASGKTGNTGTALASFYRHADYAECHQTFYTIVQGFRWEAAQIYNQLIQSGPVGVSPELMLYNLFYGWGVRKAVGGELVPNEEMPEWTRGLILSHLIRNELAIAPRIADKKFSNQLNLDNFSQNYIAQTGSKTKYGEVYSWARMVPYIQGILLYLLAMGYPFACVMIVMPGWHKTLFTWMSFWVWVKMWDAGFAVVTVVERSIWSMLGNSTKLNYTSPLIYQMRDWGQTAFPTSATCPNPGFANGECFADMKLSLNCLAIQPFYTTAGAGDLWWHSAALFDRGLMLASALDLDFANGLYIYLISALFFAVPAATGQLILGAKAGVAGMVSGLTQGAQQDAGRGASSGFTGDLRNKAAAGQAALSQAATAKAMRQSGFAAGAMDASNQQLDAQMAQSAAGTKNQNLGNVSANKQLGAQSFNAALGAGTAVNSLNAARDSFPISGGVAGYSDLTFATDTAGPFNTQRLNPNQNNNNGTQAAPKGGASGASAKGSGASATGASGTGGAAFDYAKGNLLSKTFGLPESMNQARYALLGNANQAGQALMQHEFGQARNADLANLNAAQANNNIAAFSAGMTSTGAGATERRYGAAAEFGGQTAAYNARRGLADSASGYLSSIGVDSGVLAPGNKPADMTGMAMSGMLGSSIQRAGMYSASGFMSNAQAMTGSLNSRFGAGAVNQAYDGARYNNVGQMQMQSQGTYMKHAENWISGSAAKKN